MCRAKRVLPILFFFISICGFAQDEPEKPLAAVYATGAKYGLRNPAGKIVLKAVYDEVLELGPNVFSLKKDGKYGYVLLGKRTKTTSTQFDFVAFDKGRQQVRTYNDGKETVLELGPKLPKSPGKPPFEPVRYSTDPDLWLFREKGKYGLRDGDKKEKVKPIYDSITFGGRGLFIVSVRSASGMLRGLIDADGKVLIPVKYPKLDELWDNIYEAGDQNRFGLRDRSDKALYPATLDSISAIGIGNGNTTYYTGFETGGASRSLLAVGEGKVVELLSRCSQIFFIRRYYNEPIVNTIAYRKTGSDLYGFLDVVSGRKIEPQFLNVSFDLQINLVLAAKDSVPDTIISEQLDLISPKQKVVGYGNGYFICSDNAKKIAVDRKCSASGFAFDRLRPLPLKTDDVTVSTHRELFDWFLYSAKGQTEGIIDFSGRVIVPAGIYDSISHIGFYEHNRSGLLDNAYLTALVREILLVGEKRSKGRAQSQITVLTAKRALATFTVRKGETWEFCRKNDGVLIWSQDSVKVFGFGPGKVVLKQPRAGFSEDPRGGFSLVYTDRSGVSRRRKFGAKGGFLTENPPLHYDLRSTAYDYAQFISKKAAGYGLVDIDENVLIPFENDTLYTPDNRYYISGKKGRYALLDRQNKTLLSGFDKIEWYSSKAFSTVPEFVFVLTYNGRKKVYGDDLRLLIPGDWDDARSSLQHIITRDGGSWNAYTLSGSLLFSTAAENLNDAWSPLFEFTVGGKQGLLTEDGKVLVPAVYPKVHPCLLENRFVVENEGFKTLIDASGTVFIESFDRIDRVYRHYFDRAKASAEAYLVTTDTSGKAALLDLQYKQVSTRDWDRIQSVIEDRFIIGRKKGKSGVATFDGKVVVPFEYDRIEFDYLREFSGVRGETRDVFSPDGILINIED